MTWLTTDTAPVINDFKDAEYYYDQFQPIRGRSKEETGAALGHRRDWGHKSLHRLSDDCFGFRLYNTDVVQLYRDNSIKLDLSYPSLTTNKWAEHWLWTITGKYIHVNSEHNMISIADIFVDDDTLKQYRHEVSDSEQQPRLYFFSDDDKFRIEPHYRKRWDKLFVKDPAVRYVKRVDKSAANDARKPLQPFIKYLKIFEGSPLPSDAVREMNMEFTEKYPSRYSADVVGMLIEQPDNDDLWGYAAAHFHRLDYDWRVQNHVSALQSMKDIKTALYQKKYEMDGLNGFVPLPIGVCKSTRLYSQFDVDRVS